MQTRNAFPYYYKGILYDIWDNFPYTLSFFKVDKKRYPLFCFLFEEEITDEFLSVLTKEFRFTQCSRKGESKNHLCVLCFDLNQRQLRKKEFRRPKVQKFTTVFQRLGMTARKTCIFCGKVIKQEDIGLVKFNDLYAPMHKPCLDIFIQSSTNAEKKSLETFPKNEKIHLFLFSLFFTLIGALIGGLLHFVFVFFSNLNIGIFIAAIPYLALEGFRLGRAAIKETTRIVVISISVIVTFYCCFLFDYFDLLETFMINFCFLFIGILISWRGITKEILN